MNQKTTYEITIAEKLGQLSMPDMRDAIWSRIERQLDTDMPSDDTPTDPTGSSGPSSWISITKRFGTFAAIVAIATIFFISQKKSSPKTNPVNQPASIQNIIPANEQNESPPGKNDNTRLYNSPNNIPTGSSPINMSDSLINTPFAGDPFIIDTTPPKNLPPPVTKLADPVKQDSVPKKKPRGFKGITDDDYRISLKKDSVP
jgi:hypothetical protein